MIRDMKIAVNRNHLLHCIIAVLFSFFFQTGYSQTALDINSLREKLLISTDRDIYIAGEELWLKVFKINATTGKPDDMSKVIYMEMLDKNKFPVSQIKIRTDSCSGSSQLMIPSNLTTGNYLLRAYTLFMQNWPAELFAYKKISVINPFEAPGSGSDSLQQEALTGGNQPPEPDSDLKCTIITDRNSLKEREKCTVEISVTDKQGNPVNSDLAVTVARSSLLRNEAMQTVTEAAEIIPNDVPEFLPEIEGQLISGTMRLRNTGDVLRTADISFAKVGKTAECRFTRTDEQGAFNFVADETGTHEIVIQPLSGRSIEYFVDLKQPFSSKFTDLAPGKFTPDSSILEELNRAVVTAQVKNIYEPFRQKSNDAHPRQAPNFYGKPETRINMSDYIELTSLREAVKEIIPNLLVSRHEDIFDFKLINKYRGVFFESTPLTLVDGVPVYDIKKVLEISSREVERVDVINTKYFFSRNVFDGIISIVTKKGNMTAMEFDNTIFRQVYEFCREPAEFPSPDYGSSALRGSRIPDFRNTLYWNGAAGTAKAGRTSFSFYTGDEKGNFTILIEGISSEGKRFRSVQELEVK